MPSRKVWKEWILRLENVQICRNSNGNVTLDDRATFIIVLTPTEARRLFQKLASDYKD